MNTFKRAAFFILFAATTANGASYVISPENFEQKLNEAIEFAPPGSEIILPEGTFDMQSELVITKAGLKLKGQGLHKTTLSFKNQKVGSQGVFGAADALVFEDFGIEDSAGNGLKVVGSDSPVFRRVRIAWTRGTRPENGAYGLYPVTSQNVLIEGCEVSGASDAGIYVGQSQNIIVRNNKAFQNVAGIEIENSTYADVYHNEAYDNTAGILVFNLPNLPIKGGKQTRVFENKVYNNNHFNFSTPGTIVHLVPAGLGIFVIANSEVEIFRNEILDNRLSGVAIANYYVSGRKFNDAGYDPMPRHISIYDNTFTESGFNFFARNKVSWIIKILAGFKTPEIVYDGIDDGTYNGAKLTDYDRICIRNNKTTSGADVRYANLHLDHQRKWFPYPGGPVTTDKATHDCEHAKFPEIALRPSPRLPAAEKQLAPEQIAKICGRSGTGVNWAASEYDCPKLSDYRFFKSAADATRDAADRGFKYTLNNELFSDYAEKSRFIFLPPNAKMTYQPEAPLDFPVGAMITKTFSFYVPDGKSSKLIPIETRVLSKRKNGWAASVYLWDLERQNAFLFLGGAVKPMEILAHNRDRMHIDYGVPNRRQCFSCHVTDAEFGLGKLTPIGPKAKFLNWITAEGKNQLVDFSEKGYLQGLPENLSDVPQLPVWDRPETGSLDARAKAYLDINCAHCHNPVGSAKNTGLYLLSSVSSDTAMYGRCKPPTAAGLGTGGRAVDVAPGDADKSILFFRLTHNQLAVRMPQLGRSVSHKEAGELVEQWIDQMVPERCSR